LVIVETNMTSNHTKTRCDRRSALDSWLNFIDDPVFPFSPYSKSLKIEAIETAAQRVLDARAGFPNSSLADLYDPLTMPPTLVKAHNDLDRAVDLARRPQPFTTEAGRMVFLFELYEKYTAGLFVEPKKRKRS